MKIFSKKLFKFNSWALFVFILAATIYTSYHLAFYSSTVGIGRTAFGIPKNFNLVIFEFLICVTALIAVYGLFKKNRYGWFYILSFLSFVLIISIMKNISLVDKYIGYFDIRVLMISLISLWFILFYGNKWVQSLFVIDEQKLFGRFTLFASIFGGVILLVAWVNLN